MPTGKARVRGGIAWRKKIRFAQGDRSFIVEKIHENQRLSMPRMTRRIERQLLSDIRAAMGYAVSVDKKPVPTATEQRNKLENIQSLASKLHAEIRGGSIARGKKSVHVEELDLHTGDILHQAIRRCEGEGFAGPSKQCFLDLLEDIANANAIELVQSSSYPYPYRQRFLDKLARLWLTYTGADPDGVKTNPGSGKPYGRFYDWAQEIFWLAFEEYSPRERVAEAVSKLEK
jgi:hypothetical protein